MGKNPRRAATARAFTLLRRAARLAVGNSSGRAHALPALTETLEKRQMLSASAVHRPLGKLDSALVASYQQYLQTGVSSDIQLQTYANLGDRTQLVAALKKLKATDLSIVDREVDAVIPSSRLGKLATLGSMRFASASAYFVNTGNVTSQGDSADIAALARSTYNISGAGITVGIISDSFNKSGGMMADIASNDLPFNTQVLTDSNGTDEGRAIAQVIYDSAPGVTIKFATGAGTDTAMSNSITALVNSGCKIIIDDIVHKDEPMFQDGIIAKSVAAAIAGGVTYISAAGNFAQQSYGSTWRAGNAYANGGIARDASAPALTPTMFAGTSFNFATTGSNDRQTFTLGAGQSIDLSTQWDSPYFSASGGSGARTQVDVYVLNAAGNLIEGGATAYVVGADPIQRVLFTNPSTTAAANYQLLIVSESPTAAPGYIKYVDFAGQASNWAFTSTGTDSSTIFGHPNAAGVIGVGAVNYTKTPMFGTTPPVLESFSSSGGTPILFNSSGGRLTTPTVRQEPVVDGPDNVSNTFFGTQTSSSPPIFSFSGTSAGAASVAGVAALLLSINPYLKPAQLSTLLASTATNIGTPPNAQTGVFNFQAGYGLVQTNPAVAAALGNVTGTIYTDNNGDGKFQTSLEPGLKSVTVYLDYNNNGQLDPGEPFTASTLNGVYNFYNVPTGTTFVTALQPVGYVQTTASTQITVAGRNTTSNINLGFFPDIFTTAHGNYTIQLDASTPTMIDILVGNVLTYTAPLSILPSLTFNLGGGNSTLTVNYANGNPVPSQGGVIYNADILTTGNVLVIIGTPNADTADINYQTTTFNGGFIFASGVIDETINGMDGNNVYTITAAEPSTEILTFNGGNGNNSLTVNDILLNNGVGTTFNAGTNPADQSTLTVNMGSFTLTGDPAATSANLTINDNSDVIFTAGALNSGINQRNIAALNLGTSIPAPTAELLAPPSHDDRLVLVTNSLSITSTGQLDLSGNDMIVTNGNLGTINNALATGFNNGLWNGPVGIVSSAVAATSTFLTALGILQNNADGSPLFGNAAPLGLFDGVAPAASAILIKYTYTGDTNLDGKLDGTDYARTDSGYLTNQSTWTNGDFNFDGVINGSDYTLLDNGYNQQGPTL